MKTYMSLTGRLLLATGLALLLSACGGGGGGGGAAVNPGSSGVALSITDAPVDDADIAEVWVRFTRVVIHPADGSGNIVYDVTDDSDPNDIKPYREIELKSLVGGKTMLLGEIPLEAGDYSWIRLEIDPDNTRIVETGGAVYIAKCPSCIPSNFKLNRSFTIEASGWIDFTIDFDLRKSLTLTQPKKLPRVYILRPTLRILETELASSYIHGVVTDLRTEQFGMPAPDGCWVYVYEGDASVIVPDDVCDPDTGTCMAADRPLLETPVVYDGADGLYRYNTGYIYPGIYTVALVCGPDDPDVDEDLLFMSETGVSAEAVPEGAEQDLDLVDVPRLSLDKTLQANADEDGSGTVTPDDTLTYGFVATNSGNISLTNVEISDPLSGLDALACNVDQPAVLAPGDVLDCSADYLVPDTEEVISNTATATSDQAPAVSSSVDVNVVTP